MLADDWGHALIYDVDSSLIEYNFNSIKTDEFDPSKIKHDYEMLDYGINPFDLWVLKNFVMNRNIKSVTELGCGSTTHFLNKLGLKVTSFALSNPSKHQIVYNQCDILVNADKILESCDKSDLLLIDSWHHKDMAKFYHQNILKHINLPIFMHDWNKRGVVGYSEQVYWIEHILDKDYKLFIMTAILNNTIYDYCKAIPCSAIWMKI